MKITEKQMEEFNKERGNLLEKINFYEEGVNFAENWCQRETRKKEWISDLKNAINSTGFLNEEVGDIECAIAISNYLKNIEFVFLREFKTVLFPFYDVIQKYSKKVYNLFLGIEVD